MYLSPVTKSAGPAVRTINHRDVKKLFWGSLAYMLLLPFRILFGRTHRVPSESLESRNHILRRLSGPVAHRGGQPENTIEAIRRSKEQGAVAVEVDVVVTKDNHAVLLHDATINRTSNGFGFACDMTLEQLKQFEFGVLHSEDGARVTAARIPTLKETIEIAKKLEMIVFLDIKDTKSVEAIVKLFAKDSSLYRNTVVVSFFPSVLHKLRKKDAKILLGLSCTSKFCSVDSFGRPRWRSSSWKCWLASLIERPIFWLLTRWTWHHLGVAFLLINKEDIVSGRFDPERYVSKGIGVIGWTVNSTVDKDHFEKVFRIPYMTDYVLVNESRD